MLAGTVSRVFALGVSLTVVCAGAYAQTTVYKWVDKDGVVHFSDAPPDESESVETETITTAPPQTNAPTTQSPVKASADSTSKAQDQVARPAVDTSPAKEIDISKMTLAELDQRCDAAREKKIAPLREAEIEKCKQDRRYDPAWCERFNADFGEGGRTISGAIRPRMFDDLPECVDAVKERSLRGR